MRAPTERQPQQPIVKGDNHRITASLQKVKVRISCNIHTNNITIKSSHTLPPNEMIKRYMRAPIPSSIYMSYDSSIENIIKRTMGVIMLKEWALAITKATAALVSDQNPIECELMAPTTPAYMAMGQTIFRLDPVDFIVGNQKALPLLRRRVMDEAAIEKQQILDQAQITANNIIEIANIRSVEINTQIGNAIARRNEIQRELATTSPVPRWIIENNIRFKYHSGSEDCLLLHLYTPLRLKITHFTAKLRDNHPNMPKGTILTWPARAEVHSAIVHITIPMNLDGSYGFDQIFIDESYTKKYTPHIVERCCAIIGDAPRQLSSYADFQTLGNVLSRTMSVVQLDSLLCSYGEWLPAIKRFVPAGPLLTYLKANATYNESRLIAASPYTIEPPTEPPIVLNSTPIPPPMPLTLH